MLKIKHLLTLGFALALVGCGGPGADALTATETPVVSVEPATATPEPTATTIPPRGVVLTSAAADAPQVTQVVQLLTDGGLRAEVLSALTPADLTAETRVVAALETPQNLNELLSAAPAVRWVVVSTEAEPAENLSVVRARAEDQAFAAGYTAVVLSEDWRAAGLMPENAAAQDAFASGGAYFCGPCASGWPLGVYYPVVKALPASASGAEWQAAAAALFDEQKVDVFYVPQEALTPEVIQYLAGKDQFGVTVRIVGTGTPPPELAGQWAASVRVDAGPALQQAIAAAIAGQPGAEFEAPVALTNVNSAVLGAGRQQNIEKVLADLEAGLVVSGSVPGE